MSIQQEFEKLRGEKFYSSPAKRTMDHLKPILSKSEDFKKRWIWELIQNASDLGECIDIEFEVNDSELIFKHNGKPFTLSEAYNLIMPDSSKDDESNHTENQKKPIIGQFGTGFISTHILSSIISITGIIEKDTGSLHKFSYRLDRSERENKDFIIQSIKDSESQYQESLEPIHEYNSGSYDTVFIYDLTKAYNGLDINEIVNSGLSTFEELIPFVFAFRSQLNSVTIKDSRRGKKSEKRYSRSILDSTIPDLEYVQTAIKVNGQQYSNVTIATLKNGHTKIAVTVRVDQSDYVLIEPFPNYSPVLYCAFPMIGTTDFNFPVVIHSDFFTPNRERDGIEITEHDKENRSRLVEARDAFIKLLKITEENKWVSTFHLFKINRVEYSNPETQKWYETAIFDPIVGKLKSSKLIRVSSDISTRQVSLNEILIPYVDKRKSDNYTSLERLFALSKALFKDEIPINTEYINWYNVLNFDLFENQLFNLDKLLDKIAKNNSCLSHFDENYDIVKDATIEYLSRLIQYTLESDNKDLLNKYAIVPNQLDTMCLQKDLKYDQVYHKLLSEEFAGKIKSIDAELTKRDCKEFLLNKKFEIIPDLIDQEEKFSLNDVCKSTDEFLIESENRTDDNSFKSSLKNLFYWYDNCGLSDETLGKLLPYFSEKRSQLSYQ
jgi:hypothetical protein